MRFKFYVKKNGQDKIFLSITHNSQRSRIFTGFTISSRKNWDAKRQRVKRNEPGSGSINSGLNVILGKLNLIKNQLITQSIADGSPITVQNIVDRFRGEPEKKFWDRWSQFKKEKVSPQSLATIKIYGNVESHLKEFEKKDGEILFKKINLSFYHRFSNHLLLDMTQNSASTHISKLKAFLNYCYRSGWIESSQGWAGWKSATKRADKEGIFYTLPQLKILESMIIEEDRIRSCLFTVDRLENIRKLFLFQCYTGLRFSDLKQLQGISPSFTGDIFIDNVKAGKRRRVYLVDKSRKLLDEIQSFDGFSTPIYYYNDGLRLLAKQFGWKGEVKHRGNVIEKWKAFTSHCARYTFISILSSHAPGMIVKGLADHADLKTTEGYFLQNEEEMRKAMNRAFG